METNIEPSQKHPAPAQSEILSLRMFSMVFCCQSLRIFDLRHFLHECCPPYQKRFVLGGPLDFDSPPPPPFSGGIVTNIHISHISPKFNACLSGQIMIKNVLSVLTYPTSLKNVTSEKIDSLIQTSDLSGIANTIFQSVAFIFNFCI